MRSLFWYQRLIAYLSQPSCYSIKISFYSCTDISQSSVCEDSGDVEMKRNEVYGQLPQQQVVRNPAYNWWYPSLN